MRYAVCTYLLHVARKVVRQQLTGPCVVYMRSVAYLQPGFVECILQRIIHYRGVGAVIAPDFSCKMLLLYQWLAVERKLALHHEVIGCSERRMQLDCRDVVVIVRDYHIRKRPKAPSTISLACFKQEE